LIGNGARPVAGPRAYVLELESEANGPRSRILALICACYSEAEGIRFSSALRCLPACFGSPLLSRRPREPYTTLAGRAAALSLSLAHHLLLPVAAAVAISDLSPPPSQSSPAPGSPCSPLWENKATKHMRSCSYSDPLMHQQLVSTHQATPVHHTVRPPLHRGGYILSQ
jgi:hypothetical protein